MTTPPIPRPADDAPMIDWALWYAFMGWHVMPLHQPLFDDANNCIGCTCEAWKRENRDPDYKCATPGKHPIHSGWEERATTDFDQIRRWWRRWPNANIGLAVGKSGLLLLDLDSYKEGYSGDELLTRAEQKTLTQISGNRGEHLLYQMPEGKQWGNGTGDLPDGIDVRGWGGMQVLAPSLHSCGERYQWEDLFAPDVIAPLPIPDRLAAILDNAHEKARKAATVHFDKATTERPELDLWNLSDHTIEAIHNPPAKGGRSEHDMKVVVALCYAGLTDTEILAVFQHYPIGTHGKYVEAGDQYLAYTIGKARAYVASNPGPEQIRAQMVVQRLWLASAAGAEVLRNAGITRVDAYRKTLDAFYAYCHDHGTLTPCPGLNRLSEMVNASTQTVRNHLARFHEAGLLTVDFPKRLENGHFEQRPIQITISVLHNFDPSPQGATDEEGSKLRKTGLDFYAENRADDAFIYNHAAYKRRRLREGRDEGVGSLGPTALSILALFKSYELVTVELVVRVLGCSYSSAQRAIAQMVRFEIVEVASVGQRNVKTYCLVGDPVEQIERIRPALTTDGALERRKRKNAIKSLSWAKADPEASPKRLARLSNKVDELEGPGASRWIPRWAPRRRALVDTYERKEWIANLQQVARDMKGFTLEDVAFYMGCGGYDELEIGLVTSGRVWFLRASDGTLEDRHYRIRKADRQGRTNEELSAFREEIDARAAIAAD